MDSIKNKLKNLPMSPGIYIMKDSDGEVIYVGKSKLLKNRVSQYFINSKSHTPKTIAMISNVADFDYIMTDTETEALALECNLIKKYRPKYNILLKDDKHYPYIKITVQEEYPRIFMTRKIIRDGAKYFGPYMSGILVKEAIETIRKIFKIRSCAKNFPRDIGKGRPCLYYQIGQCSAPCSEKITQNEYREAFEEIADILEGRYEPIVAKLKERMYEASEKLEFEKAGRYRDKIESIKMLGEKQKIMLTRNDNRDIIGIFKNEAESCIRIFYMRDGKIQGSEYFIFDTNGATEKELISEFVKQYYFTATNIPKEILVAYSFEESAEIQEWLSSKVGHKIEFLVPKRGEKSKLVKFATVNAEETFKQHIFTRNREMIEKNTVLKELSDILHLSTTPFRIESYDISNISGTNSVGVCVVYKNAKASKGDYRKFNIKTVDGADDYESMREVISRRINKGYEELEAIKSGKLSEDKAKFLPFPDLILLDGGKGHVSAVKLLMETLGEDIPVYGLVKDDKHRTRDLTDEYTEYGVVRDTDLFRFLYDIQEEVHRFAITTFRKKYENATVFSELESIDGIGEMKRKKLLNAFLNIDNIKSADIDELSTVIDKKAAENVYNYFHRGDTND